MRRPAPPTGDDWTGAEISAALKRKGTNLKALGEAHGYKKRANGGPSLCTVAYEHRTKPERIVSEALGKKPWEIWPSRYPEEAARAKARKRAESTPHNVSASRHLGRFVGTMLADLCDLIFPPRAKGAAR